MRQILIAASLIVALATPALAQSNHEGGAASANMQGDPAVWKKSPYMHRFYDLAVATCANGCSPADLPAFQSKSMAIFSEFGASMHWKPGVMETHLKGIPGQIIQIATADPKVLSSYEAFWLAMVGPN